MLHLLRKCARKRGNILIYKILCKEFKNFLATGETIHVPATQDFLQKTIRRFGGTGTTPTETTSIPRRIKLLLLLRFILLASGLSCTNLKFALPLSAYFLLRRKSCCHKDFCNTMVDDLEISRLFSNLFLPHQKCFRLKLVDNFSATNLSGKSKHP